MKDAPTSEIPETVEVSVTKVWSDVNNKDGIRPESLEVTLSTGEKFTLNDANNWTATKTGLPKYDADHKEIAYTWTEAAVKGYTKAEAKVGNVTIFTNSHKPDEPAADVETVDVSVKKVWNDADNKDNIRPASLEVTLSNGKKVTLNKGNNWTATVKGLPKYDADNKEIKYTWSEPEVAEYTAASATIGKYATVLTNTHIPEEPSEEPETVDVSVMKQWADENDKDGIRPDKITVKLSTGASYELSERNDWTVSVSDLPKYDEDNNEIAYTWTETSVDGYETAQETVNNFTVITNTHKPEEPSEELETETVDVSVKKAWVDNNDEAKARPASLTVTLSTGETFELNAGNNWTVTKKGLPKFDADNNEIAYTWTEPEVIDYTGVSETVGNVTILTNTYVEKEEPKDDGNLATTVKANGKAATTDTPSEVDLGAAIGDVTVTDTIVYTNMVGGATYEVTGQLMKIADGEEPQEIAKVTKDCTADASGSGEWTMDFGSVTVVEGAKYVVYETAVNKADSKDTVEHKNPDDTSQTVWVKPFVEDTNPEVTISKQDATTSAELPGATLIVRDAQGNKVEEWISESTPKKIQLAPGTYTLTELTAPQGYLQAETITFTVGENGLVGGDKVVMLDSPHGEDFVKDKFGWDIVLEKKWSTGEWPAGVEVTFKLQYESNGEWHDYIVDGEVLTATLNAQDQSHTFYDIYSDIDHKTAKFRAVEISTVEGYQVKSWTATDLDNYVGTMTVTNAPADDNKPVPDEDKQKPSEENEENTPSSDKDSDDTTTGTNTNTNTNTNNNNEGTPSTPGRTTTGSPAVPSTQRRVVTTPSGASTVSASPSVSSSTAAATGDNNSNVIWIVAAALATAAIAGAAVAVRRRRRHDD